MLDKIDTLEKARNYTFRNTGHTQGIHGTVALGQYCFNRKESDESKNAFEVFSYALEQCPAVRLVPWKRIKPDINEGKCRGFGQLHHNSYQYYPTAIGLDRYKLFSSIGHPLPARE